MMLTVMSLDNLGLYYYSVFLCLKVSLMAVMKPNISIFLGMEYFCYYGEMRRQTLFIMYELISFFYILDFIAFI